jgi:hypothetical protein
MDTSFLGVPWFVWGLLCLASWKTSGQGERTPVSYSAVIPCACLGVARRVVLSQEWEGPGWIGYSQCPGLAGIGSLSHFYGHVAEKFTLRVPSCIVLLECGTFFLLLVDCQMCTNSEWPETLTSILEHVRSSHGTDQPIYGTGASG